MISDLVAKCHHTVSTYVHSLGLRSQLLRTGQDGWTTVLLAAHYGHQSLVQELWETFVADFLHKMKVRVMQTVSGSEWLRKLCICPMTALTE